MIKDITNLYSKTVTNKDNELIQNYINKLSKLEKYNFDLILNDAIYSRLKITHNAIRLTLKLYRDTNIKVFPWVLKIACKGYSINDGTYSFFMYLLSTYLQDVYSYCKIKDLLLKDNKIISGTSMAHGGDIVIDIK